MQNTMLVLTTKYSYRGEASRYLPTTVIASSELVKLIVSCGLLLYTEGRSGASGALVDVCHNPRLVIPSLLYVLQNNLLFESLRLLTPTLYMICSQSKILASAFFSILVLKTKLSHKQCIALIFLVFGMALVENADGAHGQRGEDKVHSSSWRYGIVLVLLASAISGLAGTCLEKIYRDAQSAGRSIWFRNLQLAFFSLPLSLYVVYWRDAVRIRAHGAFQGYDYTVMSIICLQAVGGLIVAIVLKHAGNILKCYAVSISICICAVYTDVFCAEVHSMQVRLYIGLIVVISSTFMYSACLRVANCKSNRKWKILR